PAGGCPVGRRRCPSPPALRTGRCRSLRWLQVPGVGKPTGVDPSGGRALQPPPANPGVLVQHHPLGAIPLDASADLDVLGLHDSSPRAWLSASMARSYRACASASACRAAWSAWAASNTSARIATLFLWS